MKEQNTECLFYTAKEVIAMLGIKKTKGYEYLERVMCEGEPFTVIRIDKLFKVPKASFDAWASQYKQ